MRRVVITGLGMVTPLACGVEETWTRLVAGQSGAGPITRFDASDVVTKYACEIPMGDGSDGSFNPDDWMEPKDRRKVDDFILYGMAAAVQAVRDAGWEPEDEESRLRTGVMIGSGIGGLTSIAETAVLIKEKGPKRVSPFFIPGALINLISGQVSIRFGFKGPNHAVVTACSTGAHAIGDAARLIQWGDADVMIAGGAESPISEIGIAGFNACKALSTKREDDPTKASRPYDADRDGFVMGEGAGVVVLEEYEHARARGAKIYAEVLGYGLVGRCLSHHRAVRGWRWRLSQYGCGFGTRGACAGAGGLYQRAWHLDHGGHDRIGSGGAVDGGCGGGGCHVVDQVGYWAFAGGCGCGRGDILRAGHS